MSYGESFAARQITLGNFEQALELADEAARQEPGNPEPQLDRAQALLHLSRWEHAVAAVRRCLELDKSARIVDDALLDDTLWSTLVAWARSVAAGDAGAAVALLARYREILPGGSHVSEIDPWVDRFNGKVEMWRKESE